MENIVLTIGGLVSSFKFTDILFFLIGIVLILLLIYIIYLVRVDDEKVDNVLKDKKETLEAIVNNLENNYEPKPIDLSKYEQEMEDTAIISYDELVKRSTNNIAYEEEFKSEFDDIVVKKVDTTNMSDTKELVDLPKAILMSYDSEEAFIKALKKLQKNLVR